MAWENGNCTTPIRLPQITDKQISVQIINKGIILGNIPSNSRVEIYNLQGKRVYTGNSGNTQILKISIPANGTYIVRTKDQMFRVAVR